jgi:AAA family ATP:ADP antiporter
MVAAGAARLVEAAMRYSFNRTGMELLYLPLPDELRQKTKTFVDVFVDRAARGLGGLLLLVLSTLFKGNDKAATILVLILCVLWGALAIYARKEYIATVRKRLESRRLDLESMRIPYQDPGLLQMLADAARSGNARAAGYAISLLAEVPNYPLDPLAIRLVDNAPAEVRAKLFEIALRRQWSSFLPAARREVTLASSPALAPALRFLSLCGDPSDRLRVPAMLDSPDLGRVESAVSAATGPDQLPLPWVEKAIASREPALRRIGALATSIYPEFSASLLIPLLSDRDSGVRLAAQDVLAGHGGFTAPALAAIVVDSGSPLALRMAALRTLGRSSSQEAIDALRSMMISGDLAVRGAAVRALARMQDKHPGQRFADGEVAAGIRVEAREYFWLHSALAGLRKQHADSPALALLGRTMEDRMLRNIDRVFRLLGLRYPPKDIDVAWKAYRRRKPAQVANAMEFLDNILDYDVKRFVLPLLEEEAIDRQALLLFGIKPLLARDALRLLIREGDAWLAACAATVAGDIGLREAEPDIRDLLNTGVALLHPVAEQALARLAPGDAT